MDRAGIVGADGATHNGVLDVAFPALYPGRDDSLSVELRGAAARCCPRRGLSRERPEVAIRYPRGGEGACRRRHVGAAARRAYTSRLPVSEVTLVTHGIMVNEALDGRGNAGKHEGIRAQVCKVNEIESGDSSRRYAAVRKQLAGLVRRRGGRCAKRRRW
ncbi:MAG: hypothetical protein ACLR4Z_07750 [Butyricicoccaceae bacterium]